MPVFQKTTGVEPIVLDIETSVIPNVGEFLGSIKAPANYKSEEAIAKYLEKASADEAAKAALDPDLCRIVTICWQVVGQPLAPVGYVAKNEDEERVMLERFAKRIRHAGGGIRELIVFNGLDFDLVALMRRALYLGVKSFPGIEVDRYRHRNVIDLMQLLSYNGKLRYRGLDWYCRRAGIQVDDSIPGSQVPTLVATGDYMSVLKHCKADVTRTYRLGQWMGVIPPDTTATVN